MSDRSIIALLVGIDVYESDDVSDLSGCVNDVTAMRQMLVDLYGARPDQIVSLTNSEATRTQILDTFRSHLIEQASQTVDPSDVEPPAFLFHYSGHGSQTVDPTGTEPDGKDETLVPHDSRRPGKFDIRDWEIGALLTELAEHSENITVILDACHSGSGTRAAGPNMPMIRRCQTDWREQPTARPARLQHKTRGLKNGSNWLEEEDPGYVLLAGCMDRQVSGEMHTSQGVHGALTYHVIRELTGTADADGRPLTYAELHQRVRREVKHVYQNQDPQCEGTCERLVFGGEVPRRDRMYTVVERSDGYFWLDAGLAHGVTKGSLFSVYPPETDRLDEADAPIAILEVEEVGPVRSGCTARTEDSNEPVAVPLFARAALARLNDGRDQKTVALSVQDSELESALREQLVTASASPYVTLVEDGAAEFRIALLDGALEIQDGSGTRLIPPYDPAAGSFDIVSKEVVSDLSTMVRFENVRSIRNQNSSALAGALTLRMIAVEHDPETQQAIAGDEWSALEGGDPMIRDGERVAIEIWHDHDEPLYLALFDLDANYRVSLLYPPSGAQEAVDPGHRVRLGLRQTIRGGLPKIRGGERPSEVRQSLKLIASRDPADFKILELTGLGEAFQKKKAVRHRGGKEPSALDRLLQQSRDGGRYRLSVEPPSTGDVWTTAELDYLTVSKAGEHDVHLAGGVNVTLPNHALDVLPPPGFEGTIRVLDPQQAIRADGGDTTDLQPPRGLVAFDALKPLALPARRGTERNGVVMEIDSSAEARRLISVENPLRLSLGNAKRDDVVAFGYDGSFFYPVGRSAPDGSLNITWLPDPEASPLRSKRDLKRTVKLYLYELTGLKDPFLGLHHARYVPESRRDEMPALDSERVMVLGGGEVRYKDLSASDLLPGQRVAVFVHGFNSDSRGIVAQLSTILGAKNPYDHMLSWDYESFSTHIVDNGAGLANALRSAGLDHDEITLDVYAHSMGTLVTRCFIEKFGGADFVDKVLLAGPPNEGTKLAEMKRYITLLLTLALNQASAAAPILIANWVVGKVSDDAVGAADLHPRSELISELNAADPEIHRLYHVLAGENSFPDDEASAWKRMFNKVTGEAADAFFNDENDMVINVSSMRGSGHFRPDESRVETVPCDHFGYFSTPEAVERVLEWML